MKNKLHTISCHPERSEGSHSLIRKLPHWLIFSFLFISLQGTAQPYQWDWATYGGGAFGSGGWDFQAEQVFDVQVGTDNNYYFLAKIKDGNPQLAGQPVTVYGNGGHDIFIFSTTCDGTVRWSQAIGGGGQDNAYKIALDSNNNVYIGCTVSNYGQGINGRPAVHFSPTDQMPPSPPYNAADPYGYITPHDAYKTTFLVKYDSNGQYQGKKALQGNVTMLTCSGYILDIIIDSNDILHFIVGLQHGTHLDSNVTVPLQYVYDPVTFTHNTQFHLVQYDTNLHYLRSMVLPIADGTGFVPPSFSFKYDEVRNRYLLGGFRMYVYSSYKAPLTYDGLAFTHNAYVLAIDAGNGNEIWRREMDASHNDDCRIYDLVVDEANGDIYIGGKFVISGNPGRYTKIIDTKNPTNNPYTFNLSVSGNMPFITKLDRNGEVKWARTPTGYNSPSADTGQYLGFGLALRNNANEVAFATMGSNTIWDGFSINRPPNHRSDPLLMRFNKQTGTVVGMHDIMGSAGSMHMLTALAVDNDGNYVVGGSFEGYLFPQHSSIPMLMGNGHYDFFVAKLAASVCGTAVSTDKFNNIRVNVYPNPTNDIVNIETQETLHNYEVYNVLGQQIQKGMFNGNNQINLHGTTAGTYFIKVTTAQGSNATVKVIKK